ATWADYANNFLPIIIAAMTAAKSLLLLLCAAPQAFAAALDIQPGDYVALAPVDVGRTGFLYTLRSDGPYRAGTRSQSAAIEADAVALRLTGFGAVAGRTWAWSVTPLWSSAQLAAGTMPPAFGQTASGAGDVRFSVTFWPVADRARGEFVGLSLAWFEPTGAYSNQRILNIGENRRKLSLLAGWSRPLTASLRLELIPELTFHAANADYLGGRRREQEATLALTGYLRWRPAAQRELFAGLQGNDGGATRIDGLAQGDAARNTRLMLGASHWLDSNTVLSLRWGADTAIDNGFRLEREWLLRIGRRF
ncbi:MAG: transporter, partial [Rhodocyclaceae bacterium]|nr:transporter [Rhodocyclaceae bacterium]